MERNTGQGMRDSEVMIGELSECRGLNSEMRRNPNRISRAPRNTYPVSPNTP
jgi:hypothetical protein